MDFRTRQKETKSKKPLKLWHLVVPIFVLLTGSLGFAQSSWVSTPPRTKEEIVRFLSGLNRLIPGFFANSVSYDRDLVELLETQTYLYDQLVKSPEFGKLLPERGDLIDLSFQRVTSETVNAQSLSGSFVEEWRQRARAMAQEAVSRNPGMPFSEAFASGLVSAWSDPMVGRSSGLLVGLIQALPPEKKAEAFQASPRDQIRILLRDLPEQLGNTSFRAENFGFASRNVGRDEVLSLLHSMMIADKKALTLAQMHVVFSNESGLMPGSQDEMSRELNSLSDAELQVLLQTEALKPRLARLAALLKAAGRDLNLKSVQQMNLADVKPSASLQPFQKETVQSEVRLIEVPAIVGIFRGFLGGDCSTKFSFPYPNSPNERVFFIMGSDGVPRGYASGTMVQSEGRKVFYLHTINGPRLSPTDVEMVLDGLAGAANHLQVSEVAIPLEAQIHKNVNYREIREIMNSKGQASPQPIAYRDQELRLLMRPLDKGQYDWPESNTTARRISAGASVNRVKVHKAMFGNLKEYKPTSLDLLQLVLSIKKNRRSESFDQLMAVVSEMGVGPAFLKELDTLKNNGRKLGVTAFFGEVSTLFKSIGAEVDARYFEQNWAVFLNGLLMSPDVTEAEFRPMVQRWMQQLVRVENVSLLRNVLISRPEFILQNDRALAAVLDSRDLSRVLFYYLAEKGQTKNFVVNFERLLAYKEFLHSNGVQASDLAAKLADPAFLGLIKNSKDYLRLIGVSDKEPGRIIKLISLTLPLFAAMNPSLSEVKELVAFADRNPQPSSRDYMRDLILKNAAIKQIYEGSPGSRTATAHSCARVYAH